MIGRLLPSRALFSVASMLAGDKLISTVLCLFNLSKSLLTPLTTLSLPRLLYVTMLFHDRHLEKWIGRLMKIQFPVHGKPMNCWLVLHEHCITHFFASLLNGTSPLRCNKATFNFLDLCTSYDVVKQVH